MLRKDYTSGDRQWNIDVCTQDYLWNNRYKIFVIKCELTINVPSRMLMADIITCKNKTIKRGKAYKLKVQKL